MRDPGLAEQYRTAKREVIGQTNARLDNSLDRQPFCCVTILSHARFPFALLHPASFLPMIGVQAQQLPIPTTAADVPGPAPGTAMTKPYVETVGRMAYMWGWPLVNVANRFTVCIA
jgi:hypothetical protein